MGSEVVFELVSDVVSEVIFEVVFQYWSVHGRFRGHQGVLVCLSSGPSVLRSVCPPVCLSVSSGPSERVLRSV